MRSQRDSNLGVPYCEWIDGKCSLPEDVAFFPRTIPLALDAIRFFLLGGQFAVFAGLVLYAFPLPYFDIDATEIGPWFVVVIAGGLLWVTWLLLRRLAYTVFASIEERRGRLRQGVFVSREGILLRLEPNRCIAIPIDHFVVARTFPPVESSDDRPPRIVIETRDGKEEFFCERLSVDAARILAEVKKLVPSYREPAPKERRNRKKQRDEHGMKQVTRLAWQFFLSMLLVFGSLAGVIATKETNPIRGYCEIAVLVGVVWVLIVTARLLWRWYRLLGDYRCPKCSGATSRVDVALPAVHFYCAPCNIEWSTGFSQESSD